MTADEHIKRIEDESDSYGQTIETIICFDCAVRWLDERRDYVKDSYFLPGRRLSKTSKDSNDYVTPDIVVQFSLKYGLIAEAKIAASTQQDFDKASRQMHTYDASLFGWKTDDEQIETHDISLVVDDLNRNAVQRYFEERTFDRKFTLVASSHLERSRDARKIEKYYGVFSDNRLEVKFRDPVPVPLEELDIVRRISAVKFYDAEPPVEYTMDVLWMSVFNEISQKEAVGASKMLSVRVAELTEMVRERYAFRQLDRRQPQIPKTKWIRDALNGFKEIGYAVQKDDEYHIKYQYQRKDSMLAVFAKKLFEARKKEGGKQTGKQLELAGITEGERPDSRG